MAAALLAGLSLAKSGGCPSRAVVQQRRCAKSHISGRDAYNYVETRVLAWPITFGRLMRLLAGSTV